MGNVYIQKRGKVYQYQFAIAPVNGKRKYINKSGFRTKSEAIEASNKTYNEYKTAGVPFKECNISYSDYLDYWLENYCIKNDISFDLLISIEGGYEQIDDTYFIVTYASILDSNGNEFIGKSSGLQITENMFNYVKDGKSLNKVIESILGSNSNKKDNGITGYLTNGYYRRNIFESSAVISAMQTLLNFKSNYKKLEKKNIMLEQ